MEISWNFVSPKKWEPLSIEMDKFSPHGSEPIKKKGHIQVDLSHSVLK